MMNLFNNVENMTQMIFRLNKCVAHAVKGKIEKK